jgi:glucose-6-phosphate-specific signal transduction histidine kinase
MAIWKGIFQMEALAFSLTFIVVLSSFLFFGDFTSAAIPTGVVTGILLATFAYLGVHYLRHRKFI